MKLAFTILVCKLSRWILKRFGRGSSMPGRIALKLYPDVLKAIKMPKYIIAVTGSNGKSSTVEMIYEVLTKSNISVAYNSEGSNQIDGVASLVLSNCNLSGSFNKDVLLIESDERYAQYSFKYIKPTHYIIGNLYRDQMTRNGHHEFVLNEIKKSIYDESTLIINSDVPIVNSLCKEYKNKFYYFGIDDKNHSKTNNDFIYDDGYYCPICKHKMVYDYYEFGHIGKYHCTNCDFARNDLDFAITNIDLDNCKLEIDHKYIINLAFASLYNAYNLLATYSVCSLIGVKQETIVEALNNYLVRNGRVKSFKLNHGEGTLLISKHENSVSYNENLQYAVKQKRDVTIFVLVDAISRKYFTSETSWLWDINFELLNADNVKKVVIAGQYCYDLAQRLEYANVDFNKVVINKDYNEAIDYVKENAVGHCYVLTCFADEAKLTHKVEVI